MKTKKSKLPNINELVFPPSDVAFCSAFSSQCCITHRLILGPHGATPKNQNWFKFLQADAPTKLLCPCFASTCSGTGF